MKQRKKAINIMASVKELVRSFESGGKKNLQFRRAVNNYIKGGDASHKDKELFSGSLNIDKSNQTVFLILGSGLSDKHSSYITYEQFLEKLQQIKGDRKAFKSMYKGAGKGVNVVAWLMNLVYFHEEAITTEFIFDSTLYHELPLEKDKVSLSRFKSAAEGKKTTSKKRGGGNLKHNNKSNQYDIFDSQPPLREFVLDTLREFVNEQNPTQQNIIVDPCAGLGRLTPPESFHDRVRVKAFDLINVEKRQELYGNFVQCVEACMTGKHSWRQLKQKGVGPIQLQDFFTTKLSIYDLKKDHLIFIMNPPFAIPKHKKRSTFGVFEFVKQCAKLAKEAERSADVFTIAQRGFGDWWKKNSVANVPDHVEIKKRFTFNMKHDARTYFMRVNECPPPKTTCQTMYDMLSTDICLFHLHIHGPGDAYSRIKQVMTNKPDIGRFLTMKINVKFKKSKEMMVNKYGYYVGAIEDKDIDPRWFNQGLSDKERDCPDTVRAFDNNEKLGRVFSGCPNESTITDGNETEKTKYTDMGWKSIEKKKGPKRERKLKWEKSLRDKFPASAGKQLMKQKRQNIPRKRNVKLKSLREKFPDSAVKRIMTKVEDSSYSRFVK